MRLNIANPGLQGLITIGSGTLLYNHAGAIGPESGGTPNSIEIGDGVLRFGSVTGGDFAYTLADSILISGSNSNSPRISIVEDGSSTRSVTLTGPITLQEDARFKGGDPYAAGRAQIISSGVISGVGKNVRIEGDVVLSGANTFTGQVIVAFANAYSGNSRVTIPVFNDDLTAGPLGPALVLVLGRDAGEGGPSGEVFYTGGTATSNRTIQIEGNSGTIGVTNSASTLTLTGVISGSGGSVSHDLEKAGPGTLVLKGDNTFEGDTNLTNGTLIVGHNNALGTNGEAEVELGTDRTGTTDNLSLLLENGVTLAKEVQSIITTTTGRPRLAWPDPVQPRSRAMSTWSGVFCEGRCQRGRELHGLCQRRHGRRLDHQDGRGHGGFQQCGPAHRRIHRQPGCAPVEWHDLFNGGVVVQNGGTLSGNAVITGSAVTVHSGGTSAPAMASACSRCSRFT